MKRLRTILMNLWAVVSLALCIGTCVLWVRGHRIGDTFILRDTRGGPPWTVRFVQAWSEGGGIRLMIGRLSRTDMLPSARVNVPDPPFEHATYDFGPRPYPINRFEGTAWTHGGFEFFRYDYAIPTYSTWQRSVTAPCWALAIGLAIALLLGTRRIAKAGVRRRRRANGRCVICGYDLRATPGRCPECGAAAV